MIKCEVIEEFTLEKFDELVKELLYLSEDKEELKQRIDQLAKGGATDDSSK